MYLVHTFKLKYVLQNIHFLPVRTSMYSVHTRYILEVKCIYSVLVHTWGKKYVPGTYRFIAVYSGTILKHGTYRFVLSTYRYELGTYNLSRFQMIQVCTSMCPLNQDNLKKSAVKVYTGMQQCHVLSTHKYILYLRISY